MALKPTTFVAVVQVVLLFSSLYLALVVVVLGHVDADFSAAAVVAIVAMPAANLLAIAPALLPRLVLLMSIGAATRRRALARVIEDAARRRRARRER